MDTVDTGRHPVLAVITVVLQLAAGLPALVSGLIAPPAGVLGMRLLWVVLAVCAVLVFRRNPRLAPVVPGITVLASIGCLFLGGTFLGWEG